jgi:hypothetical protein
MRQFLRNNGLSLTLFGLFLISLLGQAIAGWRAQGEELRMHDLAPVGLGTYLTTGHFISAVFENWESEFLQMAVYVLLTVFLFQKGSSESRKPDEANPEDELPQSRRGDPDAPWPVHRGGLILKLYSHSLSIALVLLFLLSFGLHLAGSTRRANEEALLHHQPSRTLLETLADAEFWYESFQNWQSEFLSIAVLIVLGVFLRERGSPESKPVAAPHAATGHRPAGRSAVYLPSGMPGRRGLGRTRTLAGGAARARDGPCWRSRECRAGGPMPTNRQGSASPRSLSRAGRHCLSGVGAATRSRPAQSRRADPDPSRLAPIDRGWGGPRSRTW